MGTLANSLFQALLGWIRTLSSQIWTTASSPDSRTLLSWIGKNWKGLALILCVTGAVIDLLIYLIRWQPYRVWGSYFRRLGRREREEEEFRQEYQEEPLEKEIPSAMGQSAMAMAGSSRSGNSGSRYFDLADDEINESRSPFKFRNRQSMEEPEPAEEPIDDRMVYAAEESARGPEEPRLIWSRTEPEGTTASFEQALLPQRRRRVRNLFAEASEETTPAPEQLIDQYAAYRRPVYPRSWKADEGDEELS